MPAPPPLPPGTLHAAGTIPDSPKTGMSVCAIAAIVAAVAGVIGLFVIGTLAAIAVPAYQDYFVRARTHEALVFARTMQSRIDYERARTGACPGNVDVGFGRSAVVELGGDEGAAKGSHMRLSLGTADDGGCAFELRFRNIATGVDGRTLVFRSGDDGWRCHEGTLEDRYRPPQCRSADTNP